MSAAPMIDILLRQAAGAPVGTVVHVGAGRGAVLDGYARLAPSKVVLVEGDPDNAVALQRAAKRFPWAQVVARAVAAQDGELDWNRYNLSMLNGPLPAEALAGSYPRLRRQGGVPVPGVALSTLLRSALHGSDENAPSLLVLDVPGQEAELLGSLGDELRNVSAVIVRRCARPLPDAQPWSSVLERMRDQAFERVGQEPDGEPLWPVACFRLDRRRHEVVALRREVESLRAQLADAASALDSANGAAEQLRLGQDRQVEALAAEKAASDALATDLAARLEASVRSLSHAEALAKAEAQAAAQKAAAEHAASLRNATQALDEQVALFAEQRKLHEQAQAQFAAADKRRTELDAALTAARKRVQALEADLRQTQGSLHLAIRSRSVAESDLRDLQERYGSLMGERQATRELLTRILDRLEAVREHHARLSESATGDAEGAGVAATTSPASRSVAAGAGKAPPSGAGRGQR